VTQVKLQPERRLIWIARHSCLWCRKSRGTLMLMWPNRKALLLATLKTIGTPFHVATFDWAGGWKRQVRSGGFTIIDSRGFCRDHTTSTVPRVLNILIIPKESSERRKVLPEIKLTTLQGLTAQKYRSSMLSGIRQTEIITWVTEILRVLRRVRHWHIQK
jgi:hypothetical protein